MKRTYRMVMVAVILATIIGCAGSLRSLTPNMIRTDLEGVRKQYGVPSLGVAEITADDIVIYGPVGKGGVKSDRPLSADSYYQLGSCTKAMTATALVKLMQQDRSISWDARLLDLFPEFAVTADPAYREVTLGDIASHQAGFGNEGNWDRFRNHNGSLIQYLGEILQQLPRKRGEYFYSNNGYAALGAVIERRTGFSYSEAMNKLLFDPLGIRAHFGFPNDLGSDQPWGHIVEKGVVTPVEPKDQFIPKVLYPAGIVSLTLHDYARFLQLHLRGLLGLDDAGYTNKMIDQTHQTRIITGEPFESYAAGWWIVKMNNETIHWHAGSAGQFIAFMAISPVRKRGIVVVANIGRIRGDQACIDIMGKLLADGSALQ